MMTGRFLLWSGISTKGKSVNQIWLGLRIFSGGVYFL